MSTNASHFRPIHKIFLLDGTLQALLPEDDPRSFCEEYFGEMMSATGMRPLAPMSVSPAADKRAPGFSGVQELTTSHTSFHYFWEPDHETKYPNLHADLYSCSAFSEDDVIKVIHRHFDLSEWSGTVIERGIKPEERLTIQLEGVGDTVTKKTVLHAETKETVVV